MSGPVPTYCKVSAKIEPALKAAGVPGVQPAAAKHPLVVVPALPMAEENRTA